MNVWRLATLCLIVLSSCTIIRQGNERFYYYSALATLEESVPDGILIDCEYPTDLKYPAIIPHQTMPPGRRAYFDLIDQSIHYHVDNPEDITHETYHYVSHQAEFSSYCHEQMAASFLQALLLKDLLYRRALKD